MCYLLAVTDSMAEAVRHIHPDKAPSSEVSAANAEMRAQIWMGFASAEIPDLLRTVVTPWIISAMWPGCPAHQAVIMAIHQALRAGHAPVDVAMALDAAVSRAEEHTHP